MWRGDRHEAGAVKKGTGCNRSKHKLQVGQSPAIVVPLVMEGMVAEVRC